MSVEFLIKLRDAAQMMADAADEQLEKMAPPETKTVVWNPEKIIWKEATGSKGPYLRADPQATVDFKNMLQDIKNKGGKFSRDGYFYWCFTDLGTVGRKRRGK